MAVHSTARVALQSELDVAQLGETLGSGIFIGAVGAVRNSSITRRAYADLGLGAFAQPVAQGGEFQGAQGIDPCRRIQVALDRDKP